VDVKRTGKRACDAGSGHTHSEIIYMHARCARVNSTEQIYVYVCVNSCVNVQETPAAACERTPACVHAWPLFCARAVCMSGSVCEFCRIVIALF